MFLFQSTPSAWRETGLTRPLCVFHVISIHSLRVEGDGGGVARLVSRLNFNPLPPRGGRRIKKCEFCRFLHISIHSLRVEGDVADVVLAENVKRFQSTPSAWRETYNAQEYDKWFAFQSTPSAWRETTVSFLRRVCEQYFNPLPPRGGRREQNSASVIGVNFNPLPPRGGRRRAAVTAPPPSKFQSTPSAWRETLCGFVQRHSC